MTRPCGRSLASRPVMSVLALAALVGGCGGTGTASLAPSPSHANPATLPPTATLPASEQPSVNLVVIGDAVAMTGDAEGSSYGDLFAAGIEASIGVHVETSTLSADTTDLVIGGLAEGGRLARAVATADIVVLTVGANEAEPFESQPAGTCAVGSAVGACLEAVNPSLSDKLAKILDRIAAVTAGRNVAIRVTSPDYNPFIGWSGAPTPTFGLDFYRQLAAAYREMACRIAPTHGAKCADFLHAFNGDDGSKDAAAYLAADHLHPSLAGRQRIADVLLSVGLAPLR